MLWIILLGIPLVGAFLVLALNNAVAKTAAAVVAGLEVLAFVAFLVGPEPTIDLSWIPAWGIQFHLVADGLALFLLGLTAVMTLVAVLASKASFGRTYFFWMLFLEAASMGLFGAVDLFLFYIFWEVVLIPIFFLLTGWAGARGKVAAVKWLVMNLFGSLFMLIGIVAVGVIYQENTGHFSFEIASLTHLAIAPAAQPWIFGCFALAFAIKAPLWPFHGWMPDAYGEAPAPVTAMLAGVLSKAGVFGFLRVMLPIFAPELARYETGLLIWAAAGLVYGAFMAVRQKDMKMVTAYASLSHMSMIALGIFSLTAAGIEGATFLMVAHGLMVGGLFLIVGMVEERVGHRQFNGLMGLNQGAPRLATYFLFFALAALGLPGLPGFAGEYMIIQGLVIHNVVFAVIAGFVLVVAAWYMIRLFQGIMQGRPDAPAVADLSSGQVAWLVPVALLVVVIGVWPAGITSHAVPSLFHAVHFVADQGGIK
jgi:NADH-quinone oxidoreductase subunit M